MSFGDQEDRSARTIFVRNLSWNATEDDLRNVPQFAACSFVKIPQDRETGRSRGFCFVEFNSPEECQQALAQADNIEIDGRVVICQQSEQRKPGGFRGGRGGGGFRGRGRGGYQGGHNQGGYNQGGYNQGGYQGGNQGGYGGNQGGYGGNQGGYQGGF